MGFLDNIAAMNRFESEKFVDFCLNNLKIGHIHKDYASILPKLNLGFGWKDQKMVLSSTNSQAAGWAVAQAVEKLSNEVEMHLRDEFCDVKPYFSDVSLLQIQRGAHEFFGVKGYGVHAIAYVENRFGLWIWAARRSAHKSKYPGLLDDTIAGGLVGGGYSPRDILLKEAWEEAFMHPEIANTATACGMVSYKRNVGYLTEWATLFVYDIAVDERFVPKPNDSEVERFELLPAQTVYDLVQQGTHYKPNCHLVQTYFLLRKGLLESHADYEKICKALIK